MLFCFEVNYLQSLEVPLLYFGASHNKDLVDLENTHILRFALCESDSEPPLSVIQEYMTLHGDVDSVKKVHCRFWELQFRWKILTLKSKLTLLFRKLRGTLNKSGDLIIFGISPPLGYEAQEFKHFSRMFFDKSYTSENSFQIRG